MAGIAHDIVDDFRTIRRLFCCCRIRCTCMLLSIPRNVHLFLFTVCFIVQTVGTALYPLDDCDSDICYLVFWIQLASNIVYACLICSSLSLYIRMVKCGHGGIEACTLCHVICFPVLTLMPASLSLTGSIIAFINVIYIPYTTLPSVYLCLISGGLGVCAFIISVIGYVCVKVNRKKKIDASRYLNGSDDMNNEGDLLIPK